MILSQSQAHHLKDVLRLTVGDVIEVFDNAGQSAQARIVVADAANVSVEIEEIHRAKVEVQITVASAVPKGDRADWMIEKLSEIGVTRFIPLKTDRSVVHPEGKGKLDRWQRIAIEAAKQCKRSGVMEIDELTSVSNCIASQPTDSLRRFLSTDPKAELIGESLKSAAALVGIHLFIGPEGGWTDSEIARFTASGLTGVSLTTTILRIETAAVVAAGVIACNAGRESRLS